MPRTVALRIVPLADRPDLAATVGRWHWDEWGGEDPAGSAEAWIARVATYAERDAIPALYVALDDEEPVGSASLVSHDLPDRDDLAHLGPWLSGVYVVPERRGRGVARALVGCVERAATRLGVDRLYLYSQTARGLYERLGWQRIGQLTTAEGRADLMSKSLGPEPNRGC